MSIIRAEHDEQNSLRRKDDFGSRKYLTPVQQVGLPQ